MDSAGRALSQAYLTAFIVFILILVGLNLIPVKWVKVLTLVVGIVPAVYLKVFNFQSQNTLAEYKEMVRKAQSFEDTHLDLIVDAIKQENSAAVKELLTENMEKINQVGSTNKKTLLDIATENASLFKSTSSYEIVKTLLEQGADPNIHHPETSSPLVKYALILPEEMFEALLSAGADPDSRDREDVAVLYNLLDHRPTQAFGKIEILLKHKANPNVPWGTSPGRSNYAPLNYAAKRNMWRVCSLLIDHGADLKFEAHEGDDLWHYIEETEKIMSSFLSG